MKDYGFFKFVWVLFLFFIMGGCKKDYLKGYEKIVGTATINGQHYKESTIWTWNQQQYPTSLALYEHYKMFNFRANLSPEDVSAPSYFIQFYVAVDDIKLETNHPYVIDFYNMDIEKDEEGFIYWGDVIPYVSNNKEQVLTNGADGMAFILSSNSDDIVPLKGEFIIETKKPERNLCIGTYSLTSSGNDSEKLVINGKFESPSYVSSSDYN